ncbi:MAG: hypothetical protein RBT63_11615, partial [Bdellovibrionales bacterium]|nr:hypothetical protein [Bdellovibrionales bacterium]
MRRTWSWPLFAIIACSFLIGAVWGWKLIQNRAELEHRLEADSKLRVISPPGILPKALLLEFQKKERIEVENTIEAFPASLLRRTLKSAPGEYDLAIVYHHQVSALRAERKLRSLYDSRSKFPTAIAPDFRKLPDDRNLMDTAPLLWGILGLAVPSNQTASNAALGFWPSFLIGLQPASVQPSAFAARLQQQFGDMEAWEEGIRTGLTHIPQSSQSSQSGPVIVSHGSMAYPPLKDAGFTFSPLTREASDDSMAGSVYPMWILTGVALAEGDLERTRKLIRFLIETKNNMQLVTASQSGASTLRDEDSSPSLPSELRASHFRSFPIHQILLERDDRLQQADDFIERVAQGAKLSPPPSTPTPRPRVTSTPRPTPKPAAPKPEQDETEETAIEPSTEPSTDRFLD